jgi:hypothetical protein
VDKNTAGAIPSEPPYHAVSGAGVATMHSGQEYALERIEKLSAGGRKTLTEALPEGFRRLWRL